LALAIRNDRFLTTRRASDYEYLAACPLLPGVLISTRRRVAWRGKTVNVDDKLSSWPTSFERQKSKERSSRDLVWAKVVRVVKQGGGLLEPAGVLDGGRGEGLRSWTARTDWDPRHPENRQFLEAASQVPLESAPALGTASRDRRRRCITLLRESDCYQ